MIELKNITKTYVDGQEESIIVNDINLKIDKGDFIAIVGQSGSGKSKILHLIGGLDSPTKGDIIVSGKSLSKFKDKEKSKYRRDTIGFVFQDFILEGEKTVLDNVMMPMIFAGVDYKLRKKIALECLDKVGLLSKATNKANILSGGQQQKVAIARALVNNPQILLADEPTGNLDSKNGREIIELLKDLNDKGYTVIIVTHNTEQSLKANKIIKIMDGKMKFIKTGTNAASLIEDKEDTKEEVL